ncbi:MOSC domain-containing protein [Yinghuangia soli]|uniref:MOSC domain-containing protein n=1 Tax=Yinghuangia soli TaxID=2908204 RepID=A0AA41Q2L0_9ACTN|nr:MOSC N-terminal beta barrel domain-containing protein [Yinghuangia soli]MCF2529581.1 MOSC domain-containing protein [Yinghuangia soli]
MASVVELNIHPVKGCSAVPATEAVLTDAGLAHDRSFLVVDEHGVFRSQRTDPRLAVVHAGIDADGRRLTLRADGVEDFGLDVDIEAPRVDVEMFKLPYRGIDQGAEVAAWLTEALGAPSRLVRVPPEHDRVTGGLTAGTAAYADSAAMLMLSRASLDELNTRIGERGGDPLPMTRFRPTIVVDGWDTAHREDDIRRAVIGDTELGFAKQCGRCVVTTVDQQSGVKSGPEPLRTLATYRRGDSGGVMFGALFAVLRTGKLAVGDTVDVTEWAD